MLALIMMIIGGAALAAGWAFERDGLLYVALGIAGTGLLAVSAHAWLRRQSAETEADPSALDERSSAQPSPTSSPID
jgi:hypothetical protein